MLLLMKPQQFVAHLELVIQMFLSVCIYFITEQNILFKHNSVSKEIFYKKSYFNIFYYLLFVQTPHGVLGNFVGISSLISNECVPQTKNWRGFGM